MFVYAVDLGTTNVKVVLYDETLRTLAVSRAAMPYDRAGDRVEFDPEAVFDLVVSLIARCGTDAQVDPAGRAGIAVTGQAESLVILDASGRPTRPGISWMDERSGVEAAEIASRFDPAAAFAVTGEPEPTPTWPATKLRWLARHEPAALADARHVLMIKDYVVFRLTGVAVGEETTRGFTYLYDVTERAYWGEMVEFCGTRVETLPEPVPAGTDVGAVLPEIAAVLPRAAGYTVNVSALDHFCGMVGTGSYSRGAVSASAGTVLAIATLADDWSFDAAAKVSFHAGIRPDETVLFTCADSGGVGLDWFQRQVAGGTLGYDDLERALSSRDHRDAPLFLPYLTGINPPDFNAAARGAFVDLQLRHDRVDLAYAVMEGVAHLLRRNLDDLATHGRPAASIVTTGGGTASRFWNQLKADVCGLELRATDEPEAACRGAAILALAERGVIGSIDDTASLHAPAEHTYRPRETAHGARYDAFVDVLQRLYGP